jgi:threonine/homoserine/homoserine lactone efflux protein
LCIVASYFASGDIVTIIDDHPGFYRITALIIFVYGIFMMVSKTKMHLPDEAKFISQNYFKTFINGFLFNLLNVGVILFWLVTVISVRNQYPDTQNFIIYICWLLHLSHNRFNQNSISKTVSLQTHRKLANNIRKDSRYYFNGFQFFHFSSKLQKIQSV